MAMGTELNVTHDVTLTCFGKPDSHILISGQSRGNTGHVCSKDESGELGDLSRCKRNLMQSVVSTDMI